MSSGRFSIECSRPSRAVLPVALAAVHFLVVLREEIYLETQFGEAYREYQRAVRRWF